jgi:spermidine/putrescine transport system ATP-binding protein
MMESKTGRPLSVYAQNSGRTGDLAPGETVRLTWNPAHTFAVEANQT